jgi:site-specific DNA-methyltransferase (adenine-specific)
MESNRIVHGNCIEVLKTIPDNSVDMAFTSPPYNMNLRIMNGKHCSRQIVKELTTKYKNYADNLPMEDYYQLNKTIVSELLRICGIVFYNVQFLTGNKSALYRLIGEYHTQIKEFIVWDKVNAEPAIGEGVLNSRWEAILVLQNPTDAIARKFKTANFDRGTIQNLWQIKRGKKISPNHGAAFPLELAEKVISSFCPIGGSVIDPFAGTGTTGVACKNLDRKYILIEQDSDYIEVIHDRLS